MIWVSSTMDGNIKEDKWLPIEHKILKWLMQIVPFPRVHLNGFPWQRGWLQHHHQDYDGCKIRETQMHRMHEQMGWVAWCLHLLHVVFEIWPLLTLNWKCLPCLVRKQPNQGEGLGCIWPL